MAHRVQPSDEDAIRQYSRSDLLHVRSAALCLVSGLPAWTALPLILDTTSNALRRQVNNAMDRWLKRAPRAGARVEDIERAARMVDASRLLSDANRAQFAQALRILRAFRSSP